MGSNIAAAVRLGRDHIFYKISRDFAQALYSSVTIVGLTSYNTGIRLFNNRITLDVVCVLSVSIPCFLMSLISLQNILSNIILIFLETIANIAGSLYIMLLYTRYGSYH